MGANAELLPLISNGVAEQFALGRRQTEKEFRDGVKEARRNLTARLDGLQQKVDGGKLIAEVTEKLVPVLEEVAKVNPEIRRAKEWRVNIWPDIRPIPVLDERSGVLTRAFIYLRWGDKLALSDSEKAQIEAFSVRPESPWSTLYRALRRTPHVQSREVVEYDYFQVVTVVDPEDVLITVAKPGILSGDSRLLDTQQVAKDPKSILTPLWYALEYPQHQRQVSQVPTSGVAA